MRESKVLDRNPVGVVSANVRLSHAPLPAQGLCGGVNADSDKCMWRSAGYD